MIYDEVVLQSIKAESYVSPKVEKRDINGRGYGLFAKDFISKGEIVSISGGIIITKDDFEKLKSEQLDYAYHITDDFLICPLNPSDPSDDWRMNHCCHPNCGVKGQIIFVAMQDIEINDELTFDYAMTETDPRYDIDLKCDKSNCRNKFTGNDWRLPELQKKYKSYFSLYIQEKIDNP